ncbi:winged helix-turn-helix domain-containing protein [Halorussus salilacus]|uniref:winged helix-turn-helix domain-containing protein n=1 Tax=Halorussus salilacus TaxID=2953750 RepID=UPI0020A1BCF1|nr:winged helix-turn-helix domain-containing protein [Halorussus salilacus]USZ66705.1 winged helix-turn-helix domain-containing protein [Halorussus salilacus]
MALANEDGDLDSYAEDSPFTPLFGQPARTKILAAFVSERGRDLNVSYVAKLAGVARSTVYDHLDDLQELGVVEHTRDVGGSPMYQLNEDSDIAEELVRLEGVTLSRLFEMDDS